MGRQADYPFYRAPLDLRLRCVLRFGSGLYSPLWVVYVREEYSYLAIAGLLKLNICAEQHMYLAIYQYQIWKKVTHPTAKSKLVFDTTSYI